MLFHSIKPRSNPSALQSHACVINTQNIIMRLNEHFHFSCASFNDFYLPLNYRFLLKKDGLFIGSSSAMNCVGAVRVAQSLGPGHTIVTILCDSGMRHLSKFHNPDYLAEHNLTPTATGLEFLGIS